MGDFFCQKILDNGCSVFFFKFPAQIIFVDVKLFCKKIQRNIFCIMFV